MVYVVIDIWSGFIYGVFEDEGDAHAHKATITATPQSYLSVREFKLHKCEKVLA